MHKAAKEKIVQYVYCTSYSRPLIHIYYFSNTSTYLELNLFQGYILSFE
jgi:hypothetical protein